MRLGRTIGNVALCIFASGALCAETIDGFNFDWRFAKNSQPAAVQPSFDDTQWEVVNLPHDWAISGPFGELSETGDTGKLPWVGEGCYRKHFTLPSRAKGKRLQFLFDGVMASPKVYLNGKEVGSWIYGYNSFWLDATEAAEFDKENVLTVQVDTRDHGSRWYPGAGIYRKVTARLVDPVHIPVWGVFMSTPEVSQQSATVQAQVDVTNATPQAITSEVETTILDPNNKRVAQEKQTLVIHGGSSTTANFKLKVPEPLLWDVDTPRLYTAVTRTLVNGAETDSAKTPFGIRTFEFTAADGFHLNGRRVQLYGVNLHHDHGMLGAAFFPRAMERQLQIMKDMGVNAIRTSHNPPAPETLELCDLMGLIVWNELFDKFGPTAGVKCSGDDYVAEYAEREVKNFVLRDRNHPSVFLWSICNEVNHLSKAQVDAMSGYFRKHDVSRPIAFGSHKPNQVAVVAALDVTGWNYQQKYMNSRKRTPKKPLIYSESASAFGTRGAYRLPLPTGKDDYGATGEINAYMLNAAKWSDIPEHEFERMRKHTFVAGEFVWTGFDYLGEPSPFTRKNGSARTDGALARSSYFGIVDLAGLPKDSYYNYRSLWNPQVTTIHLAPHWNWEGDEGKPVPVFLYTNGDEAELFLNGKSFGRKKKQSLESTPSTSLSDGKTARKDAKKTGYFDIVDAYRICWMNVPYEPGELKAVAYLKGKAIGETVVRTAGSPARLRLTPDRAEITADGMDLCYVTIEMIDKDGNLCPKAMDELTFTVEGAATLAGVDNGDSMSHESFVNNTHALFYGKAVAVLRSKRNSPGAIKLTVKCKVAGEVAATINAR
jgi:beta-galactosidase